MTSSKIGKISTCCIFTIILFFLLSVLCMAQNIESKVDEYINAQMKLSKFSGSVLIAQEGKILVSKGYGMANLELDVPNTPQTKFRLGSVTKQFTAMAIMQLQEKGLLNVNDPIRKYIPDYPNGDKITIQHLLTHTSGIPNLTDFPEFEKKKMLSLPIDSTIAMFKSRSLEFAPGDSFKYSNSGYILLSYIIEKTSGKPYEVFVQENIFTPLNMTNTGYDHNETILKNRASGYTINDRGLVNAPYVDMTIPTGAGGLYSTTEDLYLWDQALYTEKLVSRISLEKMFTPFKGGYAYGWFVDEKLARKRVHHGGGIEGFVTNITRYLDDQVCIIVLANFDHAPVGTIGKDLAAIVFGEEYEIPQEHVAVEIDPRILDDYVGEYELEPGFVITFTKENNKLMTQATGQPKFEVYPESETKFFLKVVDAQITFVKNEKGIVTELILHQMGDHHAKKIK